MTEIKIRKSDKELTSYEVLMKVGNMLVGLLAFVGVSIFFGVSEGTIIPVIICGLPLTLIVIMLLYQVMMHFLGYGKMVITSENEIVLRTPRSGRKKTSRKKTSIFTSLSKMITNLMAKMMMREADKDGDGRISFDEWIDASTINKSELNELRIEFDKCDVDGDGYLSLEELRTFISSSNQENWGEEKTNNWWEKSN